MRKVSSPRTGSRARNRGGAASINASTTSGFEDLDDFDDLDDLDVEPAYDRYREARRGAPVIAAHHSKSSGYKSRHYKRSHYKPHRYKRGYQEFDVQLGAFSTNTRPRKPSIGWNTKSR